MYVTDPQVSGSEADSVCEYADPLTNIVDRSPAAVVHVGIDPANMLPCLFRLVEVGDAIPGFANVNVYG